MQSVVGLLGLLGGILTFFVVPITFLIYLASGRKRMRSLSQEIARLTTRITDLEKQFLRHLTAPAPPETPQPALPEPMVSEPTIPTLTREPSVLAAEPFPKPAVAGPSMETPPELSAPQAKVAKAPEATSPDAASVGGAPPAKAAPTPSPPLRISSAGEEFLARLQERTAKVQEQFRDVSRSIGIAGADWESLIGGRWLNKIGIAVLVVGLALFIGYSFQYLGPLGKVSIGVLSSLILLIGGIFLERTPRYAIFAKPLIGGGWALLYFTTYASHAIEAAKIIRQPAAGLGLLGIVAAGMILHSLKYRSQVVTGFAYFLGFLTVAISTISGYTLVASLILAASLVPILRVTRWLSLGLFGTGATYINHAIWLGYRMGGFSSPPTPETFWAAQAMLVLYWALFTLFDFLAFRTTEEQSSDQPINRVGPVPMPHVPHTNLAINLVNTAAFLGLSYWQVWMVFPESRHLLFGLAGLAYLVTSILLFRFGVRPLNLINAVVAANLVAIAFASKPPVSVPSRYWLGPIWLTEGAIVLALGLRLREIALRVQAYVLGLAALGVLFAINLFGMPDPPPLLRWETLGLGILACYAGFATLERRSKHADVSDMDRQVGVFFGYAAFALLVALLKKEIPLPWLGLAWLAASVLTLEAGIRFRQVHIRIQGYALAFLAAAALSYVNLAHAMPPPASIAPSRWLTALPAVFVFYALFWRIEHAAERQKILAAERSAGIVSSYVAAFLLGTLIGVEGRPDLVGLGWLAAGIVLLETGLRTRRYHLRVQGYLLAGLALGGFFGVNLYGIAGLVVPDALSLWIMVLPAVVMFHILYCRLRLAGTAGLLPKSEHPLADLASWAASALLVVLLWKQLDAVVVALAWGVLGLLLYEVGRARERALFLTQAHVVLAATFGRLFLANFTAPGDSLGLSHRLITVIPAVAIFYHLRSRTLETPKFGGPLQLGARLASAYSFAAFVSLLIVTRFELDRALAVIGWAAMGFVLLWLGARWQDRSFRIQSYILAGLTAWRCWSSNFYLIGTFHGVPERIATALPVILAFYAALGLCRRSPEVFSTPEDWRTLPLLKLLDARARLFYSLLGTLLLTTLIFYEIEGNLLTMAWTVEGFLLLAMGFGVRERSLRLSGLALLLVCLVKVFLVDLRGVETLYRIFSFIVLGVILLLVSFGYTRYRSVVRRYL
jgi:uncharacterized membrane protein